MHLIGAYVRLSPTNEERLGGESGSIVSHPKRLTEYVERRNQESGGWGRIYDFYVDKDLSGKDTNRPELQRLLQDIVAGRVNVVLVTELSRLSRNTFDFLKIWQIFQIHQVQFISLREQFDTTSAAGRMMLLNMVNFAQFEREQTIERIRANNRSRAKQGLASPSQKHVLGYDHDSSNPGGLLPNPKEVAEVKGTVQRAIACTCTAPRARRKHAAENEPGTYHVGQLPFGAKVAGPAIIKHVGEHRVIATMRKLRAEGASFAAIAERLNSAGVRTKNGGKWHHATVERILRCFASSS